jgi:UDP-glucose 4-epimerase
LKNKKKIIVTGGAGYIGSHCIISLIDKGYIPIVLDNFSNSFPKVIQKIEQITKKKVIFYKVDLRNTSKIKSIFKNHLPHAVIHCAGFKSVNESLDSPIRYFENNIQSTLSLLESMRENKVFKLIFSSSASVYNSGQKLPIDEKGLKINLEI